ncbi:NRDE protein-domain-containing protein [Aspergillus ambiguus]|uniref:NRDE protein-domain-containing protein n=1 Tax=Aspergillus ambiguus TaxID=176160 RepID=UPI003CCCE2D1
MWLPPRPRRRVQRLGIAAAVFSLSVFFLLLQSTAKHDQAGHVQLKYPFLWEHVQQSHGTGGAWYLPPEWTGSAQAHPSSIIEAAQLVLEYTNSTDTHRIAHSSIPLIIHQQWGDTDILQWPDGIRAATEKWLATAVSEGMAYLLWTDDGISQFLETYESEFIPAYRALTWNVERSDVFRILAVKWIGGIYADMDTHPLRSPAGWIDDQDTAPWTDPVTGKAYNSTDPVGAIFGLEADFDPDTDLYWRRGYYYPVQLTQWALAAARGHPVLSQFLDYIRNHLDPTAPDYAGNNDASTNRFQQQMDMNPVGATGPAAITETVQGWLGETAGLRWNAVTGRHDDGRSKLVDDILILPITGFSPSKNRWSDWNRMGAKPLTHPDARLSHQAEYVHRPTSPAGWWPNPHANVLAGRDLARAIQGTWMGITREGKVAVLTNYREKRTDQAQGAQSRGAIVSSWLAVDAETKQSTRDFVQKMVASPTARDVGGFSLVCGYVNEPLAVVSNRSSTMDQISWLATQKGQTVGLSNTTFEDRSWPKILDGERLMNEAVEAHSRTDEDEDALIGRLLDVLNRNTLPQLADDATAEDYLPYFRKSIFIPILGLKDKPAAPANGAPAACVNGKIAAPDKKSDPLDQTYLHGAYGTQQQTVILVSHTGRVRYFERTLYNDDATPIPTGEGDRSYEFQVTHP